MKTVKFMIMMCLLSFSVSMQAQKKTVLTATDLTIANGETADLVISINYPTTEQITVWDFVLYLPEGIEFTKSRLSKACDVSTETHDEEIANDCLTVTRTSDNGYLFVWVDQAESTPMTSTVGKLVTVSLKATADVKGVGEIKSIHLSNKAAQALDLDNIADVTFNINSDTGISSVLLDDSAKAQKVYNLNGQRVSDNFKGIVVMDGKKFMSK